MRHEDRRQGKTPRTVCGTHTTAYALTALLFIGFLFAFAAPRLEAQAQSYHLSGYAVRFDVRSDGGIEITEQLTFRFDSGAFSFAFRDIPWRGFDDIGNVSVQDGVGAPADFTFWFEPSLSGEYHIRWTYPVAVAPTDRTFVISYTVTNVVLQPAADRNRVDWLAVGLGWGVPIENVSVEVALPPSVDPASVATSPSPASITLVGGRIEVAFFEPRLPPFTGYRIVVDFPKVVNAPMSLLRISRESPIASGFATFVVVIAVMLAAWVLKGREPRVAPPYGGVSLPQPPSDLSPPEVGHLMRQAFHVNGMLAALLHMAVRGYVVLRGVPSGTRRPPGMRPIEVSPKGLQAVERGSEAIADLIGPEQRLLGALARSKERPLTVVGTQALEFGRGVEARLVGLGLFSARPSRVRTGYVVLALVVAGAGLFAFASGPSSPFFYSLMGPSLGFAFGAVPVGVFGHFMPRLTRQGAEQKAAWESFLRFLRERIEYLKGAKPEEAVAILDQYIAFLPVIPGIEPRTWLTDLARDLGGVAYRPYWYDPYEAALFYGGSSPSGGPAAPAAPLDIPAALASDFASFASSLANALGHFESSIAPSGGGAVGGGAVGGGGGAGGGGGGGGGGGAG